MRGKFIFGLVGVIVLAMLAGGCTAQPTTEPVDEAQPLFTVDDDVVTASAEVVAGKYANLAFMLGGPQVDVFVKVGDTVKKDQVLAALPDNALPQAIINAQADLILAQDTLNNLLSADTAVAQAAIAVRDANEAYIKAENWRMELDGKIDIKEVVYKKFGSRSIPMLKEYRGYASKDTIAKADEDLALKKAMLEDAQRELERLTNPQTSVQVLAAQTRVAAIESVINQARLVAPFDGTVVELYSNTGEMVSPNVPVLLFADLSTLRVKTNDLNEVDVARVQVGDPVKVSFDALPNTTVTGVVSEISLKNAVGSGVYFDVFVNFDQIPEELRWGMSAFVEIQVSE